MSNTFELPTGPIRRILVIRTAPMGIVERTVHELRARYPEAGFSVLGTNLSTSAALRGMEHFELESGWLTPATCRPLRKRVARSPFDLAVLCLNNDCGHGYSQASRVMKSIRARHRVVATLSGRWKAWDHSSFEPRSRVVRGVVNFAGLLLYPVTLATLLVMPAKPLYMPDGQGRKAPEYES